MTLSLTLPVNTTFVLSWRLTDPTQNPPAPINGATVVATLYAGRSPRDPGEIPGEPIPPIINLPLGFIADGLYSGQVPGTLNPPLDGVGYLLVVDATLSGNQIYHSENPVVLQTAG